MILERVGLLQHYRQSHPSWVLLASRRAPLVLAILEKVFEERAEIPLEDVVQQLGDLFAEYSNIAEYKILRDDVYAQARKEVREWTSKKLIVERDGMILSTDPLQRAILFMQQLGDQTMTSTASRLITVQNIIENLETQLNPNRESRIVALKRKIATLQAELELAEQGTIEVLNDEAAREGVREIFQQSMSLKADFRRVEDSYREADRALRRRITKSDLDRGEVLDSLLDNYEELMETPEGRVFDGFYQQLSEKVKLDEMKRHLRFILSLPVTQQSLNPKQVADLRYLISGLVDESLRVIEARTRGESDVKSYVKTGLASENYRIGALINQLLEAATEIDWSRPEQCRTPADLPPVGMTLGNLPLVERLLCKEVATETGERMDLTENVASEVTLGEDFWHSFRSLDRMALYERTLAHLQQAGRPLLLSELAELCEPEHDLETLTYWLSVAREAGQEFPTERETIQLTSEGQTYAFDLPKVTLTYDEVAAINPEHLG